MYEYVVVGLIVGAIVTTAVIKLLPSTVKAMLVAGAVKAEAYLESIKELAPEGEPLFKEAEEAIVAFKEAFADEKITTAELKDIAGHLWDVITKLEPFVTATK
jgi:hypothetical protein